VAIVAAADAVHQITTQTDQKACSSVPGIDLNRRDRQTALGSFILGLNDFLYNSLGAELCSGVRRGERRRTGFRGVCDTDFAREKDSRKRDDKHEVSLHCFSPYVQWFRFEGCDCSPKPA
jgi:hypothetical protein